MCRCEPCIYFVGDIVLANCATRSDSKQGRVDKLMHPFTGPWQIVASLPGASYALEFATNLSPGTKSMLQIYLLIHQNLFLLSQWVVLITSKDSCVSGLAAYHTRRPVSKGSHLLHHMLLPPVLLIKATFGISTFPLFPSLTTSLSLSLGLTRQSASNFLRTMLSRMSP